MKQHKWHKEIKAWADGAEIEKRTIDCDWLKAPYPNWHTDANVEYRIKSQPVEPQYLYAYLESDGNYKFGRFNCKYNGQKPVGKIPLIVESNDDL